MGDTVRHLWGIALIVAVSACTPPPERARHTIEDYRGDAKLRHEQLALCKNDPGTLGDTPDCINAKQAARLEDTRSLRELPPVRLPTPKPPKPPGGAE